MQYSRKNESLVLSVGINDADYSVRPTSSGNFCPFYRAWHNMLKRCYDAKRKETLPTYQGCSVAKEWHRFSVFKSWMLQQEWAGNDLDKDIIVPGNKVYSPDTCAFVDHRTNTFTLARDAMRGEYMIGVSWDVDRKAFRAQCNNPFTGKYENLGRFTTELEAHLAWKRRKHELSCQLADYQADQRVAAALRERYS